MNKWSDFDSLESETTYVFACFYGATITCHYKQVLIIFLGDLLLYKHHISVDTDTQINEGEAICWPWYLV